MKKLVLTILMLVGSALAQYPYPAGQPYQLIKIADCTATTCTPNTTDLTGTLTGGFPTADGIGYYRLTWTINGTILSCAASIDSDSNLGAAWTTGGVASSAAIGSCATAGSYTISSNPIYVNFARLTPTITGTGTVTFTLVAGLYPASVSGASAIIPGSVQSSSFGFPNAVADEIRRFDGAMTSLVAWNPGSTTATTPSYTTNYASETEFNVYAYLGASTFTGPSGGGIANVVTMTPTGGDYSTFVYSQTVASSGGTAGNLAATLGTSSAWVTVTIPLVPNGTTAVRASAKNQQASGNTNAVTLGGAATSGDLIIACIAFTNSSSNIITPPTGGSAFALYKTIINGTMTLNCYAKLAGASESATYTFTQAVGITTATTAFVLDLNNVSYPDELLTSASASFTSADLNKDLCVAGVGAESGTVNTATAGNAVTWVASFNGMKFFSNMVGSPIVINGTQYSISTFTSFSALALSTSLGNQSGVAYTFPGNPQSCGTVGAVLSATTLVGWGIWDTATTTASMEYRYGTDNTTALQAAINNLTKGGTVYLPLGGMMVLGTGQSATNVTFPVATWVPINIIGQGSGSARQEAAGLASNNASAVGSEIVVANTALNAAAFTNATPGNASTGQEVSWHWADFALTGGAGFNYDGGGVNSQTIGLAPIGQANVLIENVRVSNFALDNLNFTPPSGGFTGFVLIENSYLFKAGHAGLRFNAVNAGFQNITLIDDIFDDNNTYGFEMGGATGTHWATTFIGNSFSRNATAEFQVDSGSTIQGCSFGTNYWEHDGTNSIPIVGNASLLPCWFNQVQQTIVYGSTGVFTGGPVLALSSSTGACATFVRTGQTNSGNWSGPQQFTVQCTGSTGASNLVMSGLPTAQNFWICSGVDTTTRGFGAQTGLNANSCTINYTSVTANDFLTVQLTPF